MFLNPRQEETGEPQHQCLLQPRLRYQESLEVPVLVIPLCQVFLCGVAMVREVGRMDATTIPASLTSFAAQS